MPKDEFDFDDPMELSGMALLTEEDACAAMAECFIEEFLRLGYNAKQVLALFRNPQYLGPNLALQKRGEPFVRDLITEVFARWGRPAAWPASPSLEDAAEPPGFVAASPGADGLDVNGGDGASQPLDFDLSATDPLGAAAPKLNY